MSMMQPQVPGSYIGTQEILQNQVDEYQKQTGQYQPKSIKPGCLVDGDWYGCKKCAPGYELDYRTNCKPIERIERISNNTPVNSMFNNSPVIGGKKRRSRKMRGGATESGVMPHCAKVWSQQGQYPYALEPNMMGGKWKKGGAMRRMMIGGKWKMMMGGDVKPHSSAFGSSAGSVKMGGARRARSQGQQRSQGRSQRRGQARGRSQGRSQRRSRGQRRTQRRQRR